MSKLKFSTYIAQFDAKWNPRALILEFSGTYGSGSAGNDDADFIEMIRVAALTVLHVHAIVYDFRNMDYEWGNRIWSVLRCLRGDDEGQMPCSMVISDRCWKGFSTCTGMVPPMFDTLEEALACVEADACAYVQAQMTDME